MASFFDIAGGSKYVGLSQTLLRDLDLSDTIRLNHAVLVGRLETPATTLLVGAEELSPTRSSTLIRLLLPVDRRPAKGLARTKEDIEKGQRKNEP
jgi:hypothetical protein